MTRVADRLADLTGLGEAVFGAALLGASTSLPGAVASIFMAAAGRADLAVGNAVGGIAAQTAFLVFADLAFRRANLEHAAASVPNMINGILFRVVGAERPWGTRGKPSFASRVPKPELCYELGEAPSPRPLREGSYAVRASALFDLSEVALEERVQSLLTEMETLRPRRLVLDALGALRVMSDTPGEFRRHVERFRSKAQALGCTLVAAGHPQGDDELHPRSLAWGIICLEQRITDYGPVRRRLSVPELRAQHFPGGYQDFRIETGACGSFRAPRSRAMCARLSRRTSRLRSAGSIRSSAAVCAGGPPQR